MIERGGRGWKGERAHINTRTRFHWPHISFLTTHFVPCLEFNVGSALQFGSAEIDKKSFKGQDLRRSNFTAASCRSCNFAKTKLNGEKMRKRRVRVAFSLLFLSHHFFCHHFSPSFQAPTSSRPLCPPPTSGAPTCLTRWPTGPFLWTQTLRTPCW